MIMTTMKSSLRRLLLACAAGACLAGSAAAEPPRATCRMFAELTGADSGVDWEAEGSQRIVAHNGRDAEIEFLTPTGEGPYTDNDVIVRDAAGNVILDLSGTTWLRMPVAHFSNLGVERVANVYWLLEDLDEDGEMDPPRSGMTAATGPDGEVTPFVTIRVTQAPATDVDAPNKWYLNPNSGMKLCIAVGLFNK